jgi:hypothetical protein
LPGQAIGAARIGKAGFARASSQLMIAKHKGRPKGPAEATAELRFANRPNPLICPTSEIKLDLARAAPFGRSRPAKIARSKKPILRDRSSSSDYPTRPQ